MMHATTLNPSTPNRLAGWFGRAPWRILIAGSMIALGIAAVLMYVLMAPPMEEIATLVSTLAVTSLLSLGIAYAVYRRRWARFSSLRLTLLGTYVWAALLTLFNVWVMQRQMFVSEHDLILSGVLLLFAAIIATTFGIFVSASVTDNLRQLALTADALAAGDLTVRVAVPGRDEVARVADSFNQMADQLQAAAAQQRELDTLRRNLIAWTSHDLRTPLTSIRVRVEALDDGVVEDPSEIRRYFQNIRADVMALNTLIDDLFELAQLEAGGLRVEVAPHSLSDLVSDCLESFQALAEQRGIHLTGIVEADVDPVMLNAGKLGRVLSNLLSNALRHTLPGGAVHLAARRVPEGVMVTIDDSGTGFKAADFHHLFEQFYRGEQARSRATGGGGLGLAISRGIVEAHHGRIWAENRPEGGARVTFLLPEKQA
jgi:signal transduction histidine kinase